MYEEEMTEMIGAYVNLIEPYKGWDFGTIVADYGRDYVVRLSNGKEVVVERDEIVILV